MPRHHITIGGTVQGVGFRPFVYGLAQRLGLTGWILNSASGVDIEVQGSPDALDAFRRDLIAHAPPLARPQIVSDDAIPTTDDDRGKQGFVIRESASSDVRRNVIPPDAAICADCLRELTDPADRRHRYPFINCTHCGPRYTLVTDVPYDRPATTMRDFAMCEACRREYETPTDRRFHAQPIACPDCGPHVWLVDLAQERSDRTSEGTVPSEGGAVCRRSAWTVPSEDKRGLSQAEAGAVSPSERVDCPLGGDYEGGLSQAAAAPSAAAARGLSPPGGQNKPTGEKAIHQAIRLLEQNRIVALKGLGGFHLACRADSPQAVADLRERKYRKAKSFALMAKDIDAARRIVDIDKAASELLTSPESPIVLCPKRDDAPIAAAVAPASRFFGVMLPYTPLHVLLMQGNYPALVMTSGNVTDRPIEHENDEAVERLTGIADAILLHDRRIHTPCDDSVVKIVGDAPMIVRRARGYVPRPIALNRQSAGDILAVGAELKNTVTVVTGNEAVVSQHIGDLSDADTEEHFRRTIEKLAALLGARPVAVACDLHPAMRSTRYAESYRGVRLVRVQHHHAHIAAVMGEYELDGPVAGLATDGVGYGPDDTVWGCEALVCTRTHYARVGHLAPMPMPGGDAASREPWRMAIAALVEAFGESEGMLKGVKLLRSIEAERIDTVAAMIRSGLNTPRTSSLGRLFDAVSALCGICVKNTYEAQAAIELEHAVDAPTVEGYPVETICASRTDPLVLDPRSMIRRLVADLEYGMPLGRVAAHFHAWAIDGLAALARRAADSSSTNVIALAGGVLQNDIVLTGLADMLELEGYRVVFNRELPPGDGAISFGQAVVADAVLGSE